MDQLLAFTRERYRGGVVGVSHRGEREVTSFGTVLAAEGRRPTEPGDRFLLTSITKLITATQIHLLGRDGRLSLDDPVARYVPGFAAGGKGAVRIAHLLNHTGAMDPGANTAERPGAASTPEPHLSAALAAGLVAEPGERFQYSSPGFWALSAVISERSGTVYTSHLQQALCAPLGMRHTRYEIGVSAPESYAYRDATGPQHQHEAARMAGYPSGGLVATAADMLAFGEAFATELAPVAAGIRASEVLGVWESEPVRWGIGAELAGPSARWPLSSLFAAGAAGTALWIDPESESVAVLLTACWDADRHRLAQLGDLAAAYLGVPSMRTEP